MELYSKLSNVTPHDRQDLILRLHRAGQLEKGQELPLRRESSGAVTVLSPEGTVLGELPPDITKSMTVFANMGYTFTSFVEMVTKDERAGLGINVRIINTSIPAVKTASNHTHTVSASAPAAQAPVPKADPQLAELICNILREECAENPYGATLTFLANEADASEEAVEQVLKSVKWAVFRYGKYTIREELCDIPRRSTDAPSLIHVYNVEEEPEDEEYRRSKEEAIHRLEALYQQHFSEET